MTLHVDDELLPYVLGITSDDQIRTVEEHVEIVQEQGRLRGGQDREI